MHFTRLTPSGSYRATSLSGEVINCGSNTYFFDHTRTWRASPDEWSAQCRGHLRDNLNIKDDTHHSLIHSNKGDMIRMTMIVKWISGNHGDLKFPDICLTGEEKPRKTAPMKLVPTGNRTRSRCVTGVYATACSTAVGFKWGYIFKTLYWFDFLWNKILK